MTISLAEFRRFKKVMDRTDSPVDAEALSAIRMANSILKATGVTWSQVLDRVVRVEVPFEPAADGDPGAERDRIEALFQTALEGKHSPTFRDTLEDIYEQWEKCGRVTEKQLDVVRRAAEQAAGLR